MIYKKLTALLIRHKDILKRLNSLAGRMNSELENSQNVEPAIELMKQREQVFEELKSSDKTVEEFVKQNGGIDLFISPAVSDIVKEVEKLLEETCAESEKSEMLIKALMDSVSAQIGRVNRGGRSVSLYNKGSGNMFARFVDRKF